MKAVQWIKEKRYLVCVVVLALLLLIVGMGSGSRKQALDGVLEDELSGVAFAAQRVALVADGAVEDFGYEETIRDFSYSVRINLRVLDDLTGQSKDYRDYDLPELEGFCMRALEEDGGEQQQKNIEVLCQVAEELQGVEEGKGLPADMTQRIQRIEALCEGAY